MDTFGPVQPHTDNGPFQVWVMGPYVQPETITSSVNPKMLVYQISTAYFLGSMKTLSLSLRRERDGNLLPLTSLIYCHGTNFHLIVNLIYAKDYKYINSKFSNLKSKKKF